MVVEYDRVTVYTGPALIKDEVFKLFMLKAVCVYVRYFTHYKGIHRLYYIFLLYIYSVYSFFNRVYPSKAIHSLKWNLLDSCLYQRPLDDGHHTATGQ